MQALTFAAESDMLFPFVIFRNIFCQSGHCSFEVFLMPCLPPQPPPKRDPRGHKGGMCAIILWSPEQVHLDPRMNKCRVLIDRRSVHHFTWTWLRIPDLIMHRQRLSDNLKPHSSGLGVSGTSNWGTLISDDANRSLLGAKGDRP